MVWDCNRVPEPVRKLEQGSKKDRRPRGKEALATGSRRRHHPLANMQKDLRHRRNCNRLKGLLARALQREGRLPLGRLRERRLLGLSRPQALRQGHRYHRCSFLRVFRVVTRVGV